MSSEVQTTMEPLCVEETRLILLIRRTGFGEITIKLRGGKPVLVEKGIQTIKLEEGK